MNNEHRDHEHRSHLELIGKWLALVLLLFVTSLSTGCNTVDGAGEDLEEASEHTADAIDDATD